MVNWEIIGALILLSIGILCILAGYFLSEKNENIYMYILSIFLFLPGLGILYANK